MQFLQAQLFKTPKWIIDNNISDFTGSNKLTIIGNVQSNVLGRLLSNTTFNKLFRFEAESGKAYTANEMVTDLRKGIWSELSSHQPIDIYRRSLQKTFVESLSKIINPDPATGLPISFGAAPATNNKTTDAISIAKAQLRVLAAEIRAALPAYKDASSRAHLLDVLDRIQETLNPKQ
jgi:hypothetical protein